MCITVYCPKYMSFQNERRKGQRSIFFLLSRSTWGFLHGQQPWPLFRVQAPLHGQETSTDPWSYSTRMANFNEIKSHLYQTFYSRPHISNTPSQPECIPPGFSTTSVGPTAAVYKKFKHSKNVSCHTEPCYLFLNQDLTQNGNWKFLKLNDNRK